MTDLDELEQNIQAQIARFNKQQAKPQSILPSKRQPGVISTPATQRAKSSKKPWKPKPKPIHRITLGVRKKEIAFNEPFVHESFCVAQLEAELEAIREAEAAGWHVAYVIERERL